MVGILQQAGISHVLNCSEILNDHLLRDGGFVWQRIAFRDDGKDQAEFVWENMRSFLMEFLAGEGKLAIHCVGGPRRSASAAYMALRLMGAPHEHVMILLQAKGEDPVYAVHIRDWLVHREDRKSRIVGAG